MKGRPFLGVICGFFFGVCLSIVILAMGALATDSIILGILPLAFLLVGLALAAIAPFKRSRLATSSGSASSTPPPVADPPSATPPPA